MVPDKIIGEKDDRTSAIFMGKEDGQRTLSCVEVGGQPRLKLVVSIICASMSLLIPYLSPLVYMRSSAYEV